MAISSSLLLVIVQELRVSVSGDGTILKRFVHLTAAASADILFKLYICSKSDFRINDVISALHL